MDPPIYVRVRFSSRGGEEKILYDRSNSLEIWRKKKEGNYEVIDESNDR